MKKFTAIAAAIMLAILAAVPMTGACAEATTTNTTAVTATLIAGKQLYVSSYNGKGVNLRAEANTGAKLIAQLGEGMPVQLVAKVNSDWSKVTVRIDNKNVTGYCMTRFLGNTNPTAAKQHFNTVTRFTVTAKPSNGTSGFVNLRANADTQSTCLRKLYKGDKLTVIAESEAWYKVTDTKGNTGYVVKAYVQKG